MSTLLRCERSSEPGGATIALSNRSASQARSTSPNVSRSMSPVFQAQPRDLSKVAAIPRDERGSMSESDAGDQQVGPTDLFQSAELPEPVELGGRGCIHPDHIPAVQLGLNPLQPRLGPLQR